MRLPAAGLLVAAIACGAAPQSAAPETSTTDSAPATRDVPVERLGVEVIASYPHDPAAYTQGLIWYEGDLLESTGQYGRSTLRRVELETGRVKGSTELPAELFGEGLARVGDRLIQLTWMAGRALSWNLDTLTPTGEQHYDGEGWGLCFDGQRLVMSDGSSRLQFRDPETFAVLGQIEVRMGDGVVGRLNELECVGPSVYANVYTTDWIVRIDPQTGQVEALIDAADLLPTADRAGAEVLNGIAWDPDRQVFLLTGKLWPTLFAVRFVASSS